MAEVDKSASSPRVKGSPDASNDSLGDFIGVPETKALCEDRVSACAIALQALQLDVQPEDSQPPPRKEPEAMLSRLKPLFKLDEAARATRGVSGPTYVSANVINYAPISRSDRSEALRQVHQFLIQMRWGDFAHITRAAEVLADASQAPEWRLPFGESGVLDFFLGVLVEGVPHSLKLHALRLIGNSCADTDENRQLVVSQNHLASIICQTRDQFLARTALSVMHNICLDYEPGQRQALSDGVLERLILLMQDQTFLRSGNETLLESVCDLMEIFLELPEAIDNSPDNAVDVLLEAALLPGVEIDQFEQLINFALVHLSQTRFQRLLIKQQGVERLLAAMVESYSRFQASAPDEEKRLSQMRSSLVEVLSDISALPEFVAAYRLDSCLVGSLRVWLSVPQTQLRTSACLILGNIATSDEISFAMVHQCKVYEAVMPILQDCNDPALLHAATGFLKNLVIFGSNKDVIGEAGLIETASRLWALDTLPQVQLSAVHLARQALNGSYNNVQRLLAPLSLDPDSPAHSRTFLSLLLHLSKTTDQPATKAEIARLVTVVLRVLSLRTTSASATDLESTTIRLYTLHPDLAQPLAQVMCHCEQPIVRSDSLFGLALMARTMQGAEAVDSVLGDVDLVRVLMDTVAAKGSPSEATTPDTLDGGERRVEEPPSPDQQRRMREMRWVDRENALVFISKLLQNTGDDMPVLRRELLQDLLQGKDILHQTFNSPISATASPPLVTRRTGSATSALASPYPSPP